MILACWFWRRFFKIFSEFLFFCYYLPLERSNTLHLNKLESPFPKDDLCQVWLSSGSGEEGEKSLTDSQMDRQTMDNRRSEKLTLAFSSGEIKIKFL
jgi:hypothetical protein